MNAKLIIAQTFSAGQEDVLTKLRAAYISGQNRDASVTVQELTQFLRKLDAQREARLADVNAEAKHESLLDGV